MTSVRHLAIIALVAISCSVSVYGCGGAAGGAGAVGGAVGGIGKVGNVGNAFGHIIGAGKCIYEEAHVRLANGMQKRVKHLEMGDQLVAYSMEKGVHVSPVVGELHNDNQTMVKIIEIETSSGRKIPVTPMHSLFVRQCLSDGKTWPTKAAHEVTVGECVPRYHAEGDIAEEAVTNIRVFDARGIRQPVTETGTIIVDDVLISCYDRVVNQDATHLALFPYRWIIGMSKSYAQHMQSLLPSLYNLITLQSPLF